LLHNWSIETIVKERTSVMKTLVIADSIRQGRFCEKPALWILQQLQKREGIEPRLLDLWRLLNASDVLGSFGATRKRLLRRSDVFEWKAGDQSQAIAVRPDTVPGRRVMRQFKESRFPPAGWLRRFSGLPRRWHGRPQVPGSECEIQGLLRRAWAADLIQRIEAGIPAAAQQGSYHLSRLPEQR
jgi:hypothetical protein